MIRDWSPTVWPVELPRVMILVIEMSGQKWDVGSLRVDRANRKKQENNEADVYRLLC